MIASFWCSPLLGMGVLVDALSLCASPFTTQIDKWLDRVLVCECECVSECEFWCYQVPDARSRQWEKVCGSQKAN